MKLPETKFFYNLAMKRSAEIKAGIEDTPKQPFWKGPEKEGITYSLLSKFLVCPERFRLKVIEGISEKPEWMYWLGYGSMFHICEETKLEGRDWKAALAKYTEEQVQQFDNHEKDIRFWSALCRQQFIHYVNYWLKAETVKREPIVTEQAFRVPIDLGNGYVPILRGKMDSVYLEKGEMWVKENKTKGKIDEQAISRILPQNLQSVLYHLAIESLRVRHANGEPLKDYIDGDTSRLEKQFRLRTPLVGTCYNIIRRPLSDRYPLRRKKGESDPKFIARICGSFKTKPEYHFVRSYCRFQDSELSLFKQRTVHPILLRLCQWYRSISDGGVHSAMDAGLHYQFPFGVFNGLADGMHGDYFDYLTVGSRRNLMPTPTLFPELETE